jgi:hypothetical protein
MRKSRFTEAQIVGILRELDARTTAAELVRKHGVTGTAGSRPVIWFASSSSRMKIGAKTGSSLGKRSRLTR